VEFTATREQITKHKTAIFFRYFQRSVAFASSSWFAHGVVSWPDTTGSIGIQFLNPVATFSKKEISQGVCEFATSAIDALKLLPRKRCFFHAYSLWEAKMFQLNYQN